MFNIKWKFIGAKECINSNKQRWEGLKNIKLCDNFNMN